MLVSLVFKAVPVNATASSSHPDYPPEQAIDGNIAKGFKSNDNPECYPWLMVQLTNEYQSVNLQSVKIFNRVDCCGDQLRDIEVRAGTTKLLPDHRGRIPYNVWGGEFKGPGVTGNAYTINCNPAYTPIQASVVTIQIMPGRICKEHGSWQLMRLNSSYLVSLVLSN